MSGSHGHSPPSPSPGEPQLLAPSAVGSTERDAGPVHAMHRDRSAAVHALGDGSRLPILGRVGDFVRMAAEHSARRVGEGAATKRDAPTAALAGESRMPVAVLDHDDGRTVAPIMVADP